MLEHGFTFYSPLVLAVAAVGVAVAFYLKENYLGRRLEGDKGTSGRLGQKNKRAPVLDKNEWRKFPLIEKVRISHNTNVYKFGLPHKDDSLNLPTGQHISVMAKINGKEMMRSYTPTSTNEDKGHFDVMVKTYPAGNISRVLNELAIGDTIDVRGPKGAFTYTANMCDAIGMIAGGTGITPMLQIITAILRNPEDKTRVSLIFANINEDDILLRKELDRFAEEHPNFNLYYVLNNPPAGWTGGVGFVSQEMIAAHCPLPGPRNKMLICGPPPMVKSMEQHCTELGFDKPRALSKLDDMVFKF